MRITKDVVRKIADHAKTISGGHFHLLYTANPGDGIRYVDGQSMTLTWTGDGAAAHAASYYFGIIEAYNTGTGGDLPAQWVSGLLYATPENLWPATLSEITRVRDSIPHEAFAGIDWNAVRSSLLAV